MTASTTSTDHAAFLRHRWETPMTTTPPPEGTTEQGRMQDALTGRVIKEGRR